MKMRWGIFEKLVATISLTLIITFLGMATLVLRATQKTNAELIHATTHEFIEESQQSSKAMNHEFEIIDSVLKNSSNQIHQLVLDLYESNAKILLSSIANQIFPYAESFDYDAAMEIITRAVNDNKEVVWISFIVSKNPTPSDIYESGKKIHDINTKIYQFEHPNHSIYLKVKMQANLVGLQGVEQATSMFANILKKNKNTIDTIEKKRIKHLGYATNKAIVIENSGTEKLKYLIFKLMVGVLVVLGIIVAIVMRKLIIWPLFNLVNHLVDIEKNADFSKRATLWNKDEVGQALMATNRLMQFMEKTVNDLKLTNIKFQQSQEKLEQRASELVQANQYKSDFLANMSHEIRTPMNAIIGLSHLALQTDLNLKQNDYLEKIQSSANALLGIINDILDFSKIEAGKLSMESIPFQLDEVMSDLSTMLAIKAEEKALKLLINFPEKVPRLLVGDPLRLGQVLINLGNNAIKFTEQGEVSITVAVEKETPKKVRLLFLLQDTGIGMTPKQVENLFQAFTQGDVSTTRKYGGTGLGLTICQHLVSMMNGQIWVDSTLGIGSTFQFTATFTLQTDAEKETSNILVSSKKTVDLNSLLTKIAGAKILLVEDNNINQQVAQEMLEAVGVEVHIAANGILAIEMVEKSNYDLVLMDIQMPEMDGYEATKRIRHQPKFKNLPIVAMTANAMIGDREKCLLVGMNDHIAKPIDRKIFYTTLTEWISPTIRPRKTPVPKPETLVQDTFKMPPTLSEIDVKEGLKRFGGNHTFYRSLLFEFKKSFESVVGEIRMALKGTRKDDHQVAARLIHTIKGMAGNLSAKPLYTTTITLERSVKNNQQHEWPPLLDAFEHALKQIMGVIDTLEPEEVTQESTPDKNQPLDLASITHLINEMIQYLETGDIQATQCLLSLRPLLEGSIVQQELNQLEEAMELFDFRSAKTLLNSILDIFNKARLVPLDKDMDSSPRLPSRLRGILQETPDFNQTPEDIIKAFEEG